MIRELTTTLTRKPFERKISKYFNRIRYLNVVIDYRIIRFMIGCFDVNFFSLQLDRFKMYGNFVRWGRRGSYLRVPGKYNSPASVYVVP